MAFAVICHFLKPRTTFRMPQGFRGDCSNPMIKSTQKLESPQKVSSKKKGTLTYLPKTYFFFTGKNVLLNPKIAKVHEISPATWVVYRHFSPYFLGFSVQGQKIPVVFWELDGAEARVQKKKEL